MKTEITKTYKSGFALTEQEMRRVIQACTEHAGKIDGGAPYRTILEATLKDGSIISVDKTDDLFTLENGGGKTIQKVSLSMASENEGEPWEISVLFQNATHNPKDWTSVSLKICGSSRDWAFVTASDLEDRIKRIKSISYEAIFSSKFSVFFVMIISIVTINLVTSIYSPSKKTHAILQQQYDAGKFHDPIQALIALEQIRNERTFLSETMPMLMGIGLPLLVFFVLSFVLPRISPSYNFCWGDYLTYYERRKQVQMIFWTVVVLGLIVAIAANFFSKKLGL